MKMTVFALLGTVAAIAAFSGGAPAGGSVQAASAQSGDFMLISGDVACRLDGAGHEKVARLDLDPSCTNSGHPVAKAAMIERRDDGSIDLLAEDGKAVMRFSAPEGGTHVSYEPQSPLVRLVALD